MLTSVPLVPITVTPMPTALTQMEPSHVLVSQVSKAPEHPAQVREDYTNFGFTSVSSHILFLNCYCIL